MLGSDSGSSELSDASSLSSESSSGSEADVSKERPQSTALRNKQPSQLNNNSSNPNSQRIVRVSLSLPSSSGSDDGSDSEELSSEGGGGNKVHKQKKRSKSSKTTNTPISLSDSTPVYSQEVMDRSMMLSPSNAKYNPRSLIPAVNRGKGRGRGKGLLPNHGSHKYDHSTTASSTTIVDFEDVSASIDQNIEISQKAANLASIPHAPLTPNIVRKKKESPAEHTKSKPSKIGGGSNNKQKSGSRKVGRPKSVSKDVYCICRGPYDGVEFMIACDRCEEWFHGRCIGMKPQEAKKSSHYYCDTCQKIRRVFGVATTSEESSKPSKSKVRSKKSPQRQDVEHSSNKGVPSPEEKNFPIKIKAKVGSKNTANIIYSPKDSTSRRDQVTSSLHEARESIQSQSLHMESHHQAATVPIRKSDAVEAGHYSSHYDTHSTNAQASIMPTQPSFSNVKPQDRVSQDDDDEEICPICDFECTCSKGKDDPIEPIPSNANPEQIIESSHALTAIKVPFQPFIGANSAATTDPHSTGHVDIEGRGSYFDAEKRPVAVIVKEETRGNGAGDEFRTSAKNPMAVPTSQRRPSINMRSSGKNIGKYLKSSKSNMSMYHVSNFDSETDKSSEDEDIEGEIGDQIGSRTRYESESDEADDVDDLQSLSSSDDIEAVQERYANQRLGKGNKINLGKKWLKSQSSNSKTKGLEGVKKRGPGRPKKKKDPLIVSPEDEIALYTPAAATRKLTSPQLTGSIIRATNNVKSRAEYPVISYDLDVAEDVMALNASEGSGRDPDEGEAAVNVVLEQIEGELYESLSEADLLGDGDLSDELSGDLSDIMSDDFDGFSEESMDLSSSDEEDETDSSNPREFNYSDMEEQDESLVDSDSSPNSEASDSTDSSDSDSGSDSDEDDIIPYEHEELDESIDEEELQLLEEQERSILSKAHGLLDVFSEEDSDPDRNPFESSDEDEDNDERETDDDDEEVYSDEYYEDEYEEEVYDGMDEQEILARLKGVQSDLQALMMIPAEQQEQLLLLQHYEEAHRQQQEQQVDISGNQFQSTQIQQIGNQHLDPTQRAQLAGLLETPNFLPQFDINVPNLDEVSRQLAASIAESIAQSMAEVNKPGEESSIFPMTALGENISMQLENISGLQDAGIQLNLTSGMSDIPWDTPIPPSPTIPTPTNTPTPPGTSVEISPFAMGSSEFASSQNGQSIISQDSTMDGSGLQQEDMQQQSQNSVQITLSTSKINGESINPTPPQLVPQLKSEVSDTVAQLNIQGNLSECANIDSSQNDSCSLTRVNTGDTTDDDNTPRATQFSDLKKRKGDSLGVSEVGSNEGKRRRLSNTTLKEDTNDGAPLSTPTPESESSSSPNSQAIQLQTELISSFDATSTNSSIDSPSSFSTTPTADMNSSIAYDFSKAGMPFVDPSAKIFDSAPRKHDSVSRLFRNSLKGKESKYHVDLMPMDDLLDTSAFYGRSSSRSPSPNRSGGGEEDNDDEISQSVLKDLNRWQRVPIGTFRKSRRPSSPYVGIKDALKSGNVTMPTTLLEDHQQHQRQLLQESQHRLRRKSSSAKKHRNTSFRVSDLRGQGVISGDPTHHHYQPRSDKVRRRRPIAGDSSHHSNNKLMLKPGESSVNAGLGIGLGNLTGPNISIGLSPITTSSKSRSGSSRRSVVGGDAIDHDTGMHVLKDLMTDSSQLPSSACPTPLHSPLFSATAAGGRVLHHASGEPEGNGIEKMNGLGNNDVESQIEDSIVSHLDLDIGKEMDGFHERLLAKSKALKEEK